LYPQKIDFVAKGQNLIDGNKLDEAIVYFNSNIKKAIGDDQKIHLFFGLADAHKLKIEYNKAQEYYLKAYKLIQKKNDIQLEFLYHVKIAEFFRKRRLLVDAVQQLDIASTILSKNKIKEVYLIKYYSRKAALSAEHFQNNDSTLFYSSKALEIGKKLNDNDIIFYSQLEIAGVYEFKNEFKKAIPYLVDVIKFAKLNKLHQQEADAYINYIKVLAGDNQLEKALKTAIYAANFAKKNKLYLNELYCYVSIHDLYHKLNDIENAYKYLKIRLELTDKYNNVKKEELLLNLEAKYKFIEKESEIKINKLEITNKNKALASNKINFYITIFVLAVVLFVAILIFYFLKKSRKSNKQLQFLSEQNEFLLSEANHRINNNLQLIIILISGQLDKIPENESFEIKKILSKVDSIATLHRHLYQSTDKTKVDLNKYLTDIQMSFFELFKENNVVSNFEIQPLQIRPDTAMYLGLLLTELCINSLKHAFENQNEKEINFTLKQENDIMHFFYADNGNKKFTAVLKPVLIDELCKQLKLDYTIENRNGFTFSFKKKLI
jgi:two-component sensor histidine kinase